MARTLIAALAAVLAAGTIAAEVFPGVTARDVRAVVQRAGPRPRGAPRADVRDRRAVAGHTQAAAGHTRAVVARAHPRRARHHAVAHSGPFAVGEIVVHYTDTSRTVRFPGRKPQPRPLVTVIRYPASGHPSARDVWLAPPATAAGPFPLIVFGHGFDVTPATYWRLLHAWAQAGYVVAAPVFPLTNAHAPGGANEADIVNQPRDMSFVITQLLAAGASSRGILSGLVDPHAIAVAGQSDGGETALAAAFDPPFRDPRVDAAVILSGAELPVPGFTFTRPSPPVLATQGTADTINLPKDTYRFFRAAPPPKFLLKLLGAPHLPPYTDEQPQLGVVERVTTAFLDDYLKHAPGAWARLWAAGNTSDVSRLSGEW